MCNWGTLGICTLLEMKRWWVFCLGFFICLGRFSWFPLSCFCDWQPEIPPPVVRATSPHSSCHQFLLLLFHFLLLLQRGRANPLLLVAGYCPWRPGTANKAFSLHFVVGISNLMEPCFRFSLEEMKQEMAFSPCPLPQRHPVHQLMRWYYAWETRFVGVCVCCLPFVFLHPKFFSWHMYALSILPFISLESMNYKNVQGFFNLRRLQTLDVQTSIYYAFLPQYWLIGNYLHCVDLGSAKGCFNLRNDPLKL